MRIFLLCLFSFVQSGCAVIAVADLAVTSAATVAKAGIKTVGAVVDAVIPDKKPEADKAKGR